MSLPSSNKSNVTLDNHAIYFALFFTQLTAIIAQGSLRSSAVEMIMQIFIWGVLLGFSLAFGWQYRQQSKSKLPEQLTNGAAMVGMLAFLFQLLNGDLTAGLLLMLSWLLVGLSFSLNKQRSLYFALAASTVLLLYAASISKSSSFIAYIIIYTLSAIIALASNFYLSKSKQQISSVLTNSASSSKQTGFPFKLPITVLAGVILLITSVIYLLVPRPTAMHWGTFPAGGGQYQADESWPQNSEKDQFNDSTTGDKKENERTNQQSENNKNGKNKSQQSTEGDEFYYSGFNDELKLDEANGKQNYNRLILYMEGKEPQYLRGNIYDYFDGRSWKTSEQIKQRLEREDNKFKINSELKAPYEQYTITMAANIAGKSNLFIPADTAELQFPSNVIAKDNYGAFFAPSVITKDTFYSIKISPSRMDGRPLDPVSSANQPSETDLERYTQLPKNLSNKFYQFSEHISKDADNVIQKAGKIEAFLRKNYKYSLESVYSSQGKIPLEEFLFERPLGHCEYFATAMVTLMRAQDIPARLVTGFSATQYNPVTGYYEARSLDAHAWAEIWIEDKGWVTFEATPPYALPAPSNAQNTSQSIEEYLNQRSENAKLSDPTSIATALLNSLKNAFQKFNILLKKAWDGIKTAVVWSGELLLYYGWLILIICAVIYSMVHYLRYYLAHRTAKKMLREVRKKTSLQQLETSYAVMEKVFSLYQHPRPEGWTIQQYQASLSTHFPSLSDEINQISHRFNIILYDQEDVIDNSKATDALKNAQKIVNYKFDIPRPAEKQIQAWQKLFEKLSFRNTTA